MDYKYYELGINFDPEGKQPKIKYDNGDVFVVYFYVPVEKLEEAKAFIHEQIKPLLEEYGNEPYIIDVNGKKTVPYISSFEDIRREINDNIPYLIGEVKPNPFDYEESEFDKSVNGMNR